MLPTVTNAVSNSRSADRAGEIFREQLRSIYTRTDILFASLMILQWTAGVAVAVWISPQTWIGTTSKTHIRVWAAIVLGGVISMLPVYLTFTRPGANVTRHVNAVAQMLFSALLIHLTGGRIETHFHVFVSLALLAAYRDWRVLISATLTVLLDHVLRGVFWPESVYGVLSASVWRSLEHGGWVVLENVFLTITVRQSLREMQSIAGQKAELEETNEGIETLVKKRTLELEDAIETFAATKKLTKNSPIR